jgi:hypothetical protein
MDIEFSYAAAAVEAANDTGTETAIIQTVSTSRSIFFVFNVISPFYYYNIFMVNIPYSQ